MNLIDLTRRRRSLLTAFFPYTRPAYISKALRFQLNSPLAQAIRDKAMEIGGELIQTND